MAEVTGDLSDGRQATQGCGEGVGQWFPSPHVSCGRRYSIILFFSLSLYSPCLFFRLSRAPFSSLFFLFTPQWHSPFLRAGSSNPLLLVSRWPPSIPTVLCCLTSPSTNKTPLTTPTPCEQFFEMGKFIWHEHARYVSITASVCKLTIRLFI